MLSAEPTQNKNATTEIDQAPEWHVCGVVVQCRPADIPTIKTTLEQLELTKSMLLIKLQASWLW